MSHFVNRVLYLVIVLLIPVVLIIPPCFANELPVADFSGSSESTTVSFDVQFTDLSTGTPSSWYWLFGDGGFSYLENPRHIYSKPGVYNVILDISDKKGDTSVKEKYLDIGSTVINQTANLQWNTLFYADPSMASLEMNGILTKPEFIEKLALLHNSLVRPLIVNTSNEGYNVKSQNQGFHQV